MKNEAVIKRTLKFGHGDNARIYLEGEIIRSPLPPELLQELSFKTGTVAWVGEDRNPPDHYNLHPVAREVFKPKFGPRGDYVAKPVRPPSPDPRATVSKSQGVIVPKQVPKVKKALVIRRTASESEQKDVVKLPEKPKVKLSLRTR
jgi:hypothetical protein